MARIAWATSDFGRLDLTTFKLGGAGWARMGLPSKCLAEFGGHTVGVFRSWGFNAKTLQFQMQDDEGNISEDWDIVVFQRWMHKQAPELIQAAKHSGQILFNDLDDHYFGLHPSNQAWTTSHPKMNEVENRNHYWKVLAASDGVSTSTRFLTDYLKRNLGKTDVQILHLPNMIDLSLYKKRPVIQTHKPVIGWVGGTPWRSGDLETLRGILPSFIEEYDLRFYHGGHHVQAAAQGKSAHTMLGIPEERFFWRPMCAIDDYPDLFEPMDIGIAPLAELPFNQAKSAIKNLEYSAAGVPYVAQKLSEYSEYDDYLPECTVKNAKQWRAALTRLLDPDERRKRQVLQYERVAKEDIHVRWKDWEQLIDMADDIRTKRAVKMTRTNALLKEQADLRGLNLADLTSDPSGLHAPEKVAPALSLIDGRLKHQAAMKAQDDQIRRAVEAQSAG